MATGTPDQPIDEQSANQLSRHGGQAAISSTNTPSQPSVIDGLLAKIQGSLQTIRANRWVMAAVFATAVPFFAQTAEAKGMISLNDYKPITLSSREITDSPCQLKDLLQMSSGELEARVKKMTLDEIQEVIDVLDQVSTDASKIARTAISDKLLKNIALTDSEKKLFIEMAQKYGIENSESIRALLDKKQLTPTQAKYLLIQFKEILKAQEEAAERSVAVRRIADAKAESLNGWDLDASAREAQKYADLMKSLDEWEKNLSAESVKK